MLTGTPDKDAIGEETKAKTKEVSTGQQTTQKSKKEQTQNIKKKKHDSQGTDVEEDEMCLVCVELYSTSRPGEK